MTEPVAWPGPSAGETPEHPPVESTDRRATPPEDAAVPGHTGAATGEPDDTWEAQTESPPVAEAAGPVDRPGAADALDRRIRELEDEIRRLKSG
ncbi:MAG: hypothetical protein KY455_13570 [Euryarchaeota archaeon]|nr:hypothetical protein [Euryarchaeota archaeon]